MEISDRDRVIRYLRHKGRATTAELASLQDLSRAKVRSILVKLSVEGIVGLDRSRGRPFKYIIMPGHR